MKAASFTSIQILPHFGTQDVRGYDVHWQVTVTDFAPTFDVEESETESGPWTVVNELPITDNFLLEVTGKVLVLGPVRWFRVKVKDGNAVIATSPPMDSRNSLNRHDYLHYRDLLRRFHLQLNKAHPPLRGVPGKLIRRKLFGAPCTKCRSVILGTSTSTGCTVCFGTGIQGGYHTPICMLAQINGEPPRSVNTTKTPGGPVQVDRESISLFPVPDAKLDDIWIDTGTNYRYLVEKVEVRPQDSFCGSAIRQTLVISLQAPKHDIYNVPAE